ncbi:hypothetical protein EVAR_4859_1 [Eumeta japonica]|uniref:Uncharacterized protein n=1 Tax=Eumeta variegata TaxID=151549 RepID=A0A4C1SZW8_EUMVA|nr:hypothetical protein EVAR_4859_1 [Eumeta japonica]
MGGADYLLSDGSPRSCHQKILPQNADNTRLTTLLCRCRYHRSGRARLLERTISDFHRRRPDGNKGSNRNEGIAPSALGTVCEIDFSSVGHRGRGGRPAGAGRAAPTAAEGGLIKGTSTFSIESPFFRSRHRVPLDGRLIN